MIELSQGDEGGVVLRLVPDEAELLRRLVEEMQTLLEAEIPREDAVIARLFPRAYESDSEERAFRDMVDHQLTSEKRAALETVRRSLGGSGAVVAELEAGHLDAWLRVLTDMRLAIGTRLGVDEETMATGVDPADPNGPALTALHWLGSLQERLVRAAGT